MRRTNASWVALLIASVALFTSLGGAAWAASLINGSQIQNRSISGKKIGRGQVTAVNLGAGAVTSPELASGAVTSSTIADQAVTTSKLANDAVTSTQLADGAVTGTKVAAGSLTAADVAPNTFLAANGTAANANQLGDVPASGFVQGTGNMLRNWVEIPVGTSDQTLLDVGLGEIDGSCLAGDKPQVSFTAETQPLNLIEWGTTFPNAADINTSNGLTVGSTYQEPNTSGLPQAIQFQVAQTGVAPPHVATAWTTDQANGGAACIFTAQALTTGAQPRDLEKEPQMHRCLYTLLGLGITVAFALPATASADVTLGSVAQPAGSSPGNCAAGYMIGQQTSDPSTPDTVPPPGGQITGWQTNTTGDTAGSELTLVVLRPNEGAYTVVGVDPEVLPTPLPTDGIATFTLPTPLQVQGGDVLSLYSFNGVGNCAWGGVSDAADRISLFMLAVAPGPADSETPLANTSGYLLDVAATLAPSDVDAGVTTSAGPSGATAGHPALLISTVINNGPASAPITFNDQVPAGLTINSAAAADGTCSTSGQTVTCTITGLPAGQSVPVEVIATPSAAGSYANSVSIALNAGATDPNPTNNTAAATLSVVSGASPGTCIVPALRGLPSAPARTVLNDLGCKVKTAKAHSKSIHKGTVVSTDPGRGTYAPASTITLIISSGPKKHK